MKIDTDSIAGKMAAADGGRYYLHNEVTGKQESLGTSDRNTALRLLHSKNESHQLPAINLQIARAYLMAADPLVAKRSWRHVMEEIVKFKTGSTLQRWQTAIKDKAFDLIRPQPLLESRRQRLRSLRDMNRNLERFGTASVEQEAEQQTLEVEDLAQQLIALERAVSSEGRHLRRFSSMTTRAQTCLATAPCGAPGANSRRSRVLLLATR